MPRAAGPSDTPERILKAALETFSEKGFEGAKTRDIAARARVTLAACAALLFAAPAAASSKSNSSNDFVNFFELIFDDNSSGKKRAGANLDTNDVNEVIFLVSVVEEDEGEVGLPRSFLLILEKIIES